jgi:hypothetical protein
MQRIADALRVSQRQISRDLECLDAVSKPARPKGGWPKGSKTANPIGRSHPNSTGLVQLLVEVTLIDLEAGDIQRFGQPDVAFIACLLCCRAESFHPVRQLS